MALKYTYRVVFIFVVCICSVQVSAQQTEGKVYSYEFRGEPLDKVLDRVARDTGTDLIYDPQLVAGAEVFQRINRQTIKGVLRLILTEHGLDYLTLSSGTMVIIRMASEDPVFGTFSGTIVDSRTGEPLPGANVMLADASGGTSTGRSGNFSLARLLSGEHIITFSYIGYEPVTKNVRISPNEQIREKIELQPKQVLVSPVVVEAHHPKIRNSNGIHSELTGNFESAGMMRSPIRDLSLLPGIQYGLPMKGLHLQGGQKSEHRMRLDGAPVYNPYSIGQMFSSFSPQAIGRVTLHQTGYGAAEGSLIAGIIDLSHEMPPAGYKGATIQADPLSINIRGDLSFQFEDESSFSVMSAFRTNYWDTYKDPVLERSLREWDRIDPLITNQTSDLEGDASFYTPINHLSEVDFFDLHLASQFRWNPYHKISASFYASDNSLGTAVLNQSIPQANLDPFFYAAETYNWKNRVGRISWSSLLTPRADLNTQLSHSYGSFGHGSEINTGMFPISIGSFFSRHIAASMPAFDSEQELRKKLPLKIGGNDISHFIAKTDLNYSFSSVLNIETGLQYEHVSSSVDMEEGNYLPTFADVQSTMISSHATGNYRWSDDWHLSLGSRFTWLNENSAVYAEPRVSVQYDKADSRIGYWSGRLSAGIYRQFINEYSITNTGATAVVPSFSIWSHAGTTEIPKAYHLNSSWFAEFSEKSNLHVEAFYKWQPITNITSYHNLISGDELDRSQVNAFAESTEMTALGAGIRFNQTFFDSRLSLFTGYDYSYTRLDLSSQFGKTLPASWSDPHRAQVRAMWHLLSDLTIAGKWMAIWDRRWAYRDSYYNYLQVSNPHPVFQNRFDNPENDRLRAFSQIDLSMIYQPTMGRTDLEIRLDLVNILNRRNPLDRSLLPIVQDGQILRYDTIERTLPGFYPTISVQVKL